MELSYFVYFIDQLLRFEELGLSVPMLQSRKEDCHSTATGQHCALICGPIIPGWTFRSA
jgi:hypothetical protein